MSSYPPTPQRKACDCSDPCISTDDVYYAGPNLPNSGINTYNVLTSVIEKLDAIYAVPTLQKVTETGNITTLPIIADSFVKIGGDGSNVLLDDGTVLPIGDLPTGVTETSQLINDGEDGINPFITALDIPAFNPSDYDLDEFTNLNVDPFAKISDIPPPVATALVFLDEGNGNGIVRIDRDPAHFGNIGEAAFDISIWDSDMPDTGDYGATGYGSFAVGYGVKSKEYTSSSFGYAIDNAGIGSFDTGFNLKDVGYTNFVTGMGHDVTSTNSTVVGQASNIIVSGIDDFNAYPTKPLFVVGNGTIQNADPDFNVLTRSDAFIVRMNGLATLPSVTNALIDSDTTGKAVATKEYVDAKRPYKVYTALLNQTGTSDPVPTELENTIGGTFTYSYGGVGIYSFTVTGIVDPFTLNKTAVFISGQPYGIGFGTVTTATILTTQGGNILTQQGSGGVNSYLVNTAIEIRVYN